MKIGFDAKRAFYNTRGLGNYSRDTIRILSNIKKENDYFLFTPGGKNKLDFDYSRDNCTIIEPNGFFYTSFPSVWRTFGECKDIKKLDLDIFHGLSHELPVGIEKTGAGSVVTMHDVIFLKFPHLYPWIDRQLYKRKYLSSCRKADRVIAISKQTKQDLVEYVGVDENKIQVVYQGCNPIFLKETSDETIHAVKQKYNLPTHYLLNVGAIEKRKNQELIIKALSTKEINIPLVIVGKPTNYINELKQLIKKGGIESSVIFLHNVATEDLPAIYSGADIFVYPSVFEGFGIPILEALNSKVPVIASTGTCFEETGGEGSIYIDHTDVDELIHAIKMILNNNEKRERMIREGIEYASLFSDENIAENMMKIYTELRRNSM